MFFIGRCWFVGDLNEGSPRAPLQPDAGSGRCAPDVRQGRVRVRQGDLFCGGRAPRKGELRLSIKYNVNFCLIHSNRKGKSLDVTKVG